MPPRKRKPAKAVPAAPAPAPPVKAKPEEPTFTEWEASLSERERRIEEIVGKMLSCAWLSGVSDQALAKEWNYAPNTIRKMAAEASRMLKYRVRSDDKMKDEARAELIQTFAVIRAKAFANGDSHSLRVALDASRAYGFYLGIEPAKQVDVAHRTSPVEGWSPAEMLEYAQSGKRPARRALKRAAQMMRGGRAGNGFTSGMSDDDGQAPEEPEPGEGVH
jgi:hypothetical protein